MRRRLRCGWPLASMWTAIDRLQLWLTQKGSPGRESARAWYMYSFFFVFRTHCERQNGKVSGAVVIFSTFALIVYVTSMNMVYSLSTYEVGTSANE